jgi:hypothetical protein
MVVADPRVNSLRTAATEGELPVTINRRAAVSIAHGWSFDYPVNVSVLMTLMSPA